jgi:hypothetical protein
MENGVPTSHRQTLSHNVVLSKPRLSGIQTHNGSGDRHWLHNKVVTLLSILEFFNQTQSLNNI